MGKGPHVRCDACWFGVAKVWVRDSGKGWVHQAQECGKCRGFVYISRWNVRFDGLCRIGGEEDLDDWFDGYDEATCD